MAEHNYWMPCEKAVYLTATLNELAAHILHGVPTRAAYKEAMEVLEYGYGDHHLEAVFHSTEKMDTDHQEIPARVCRWHPPLGSLLPC
jgi:hypothetical protein